MIPSHMFCFLNRAPSVDTWKSNSDSSTTFRDLPWVRRAHSVLPFLQPLGRGLQVHACSSPNPFALSPSPTCWEQKQCGHFQGWLIKTPPTWPPRSPPLCSHVGSRVLKLELEQGRRCLSPQLAWGGQSPARENTHQDSMWAGKKLLLCSKLLRWRGLSFITMTTTVTTQEVSTVLPIAHERTEALRDGSDNCLSCQGGKTEFNPRPNSKSCDLSKTKQPLFQKFSFPEHDLHFSLQRNIFQTPELYTSIREEWMD